MDSSREPVAAPTTPLPSLSLSPSFSLFPSASPPPSCLSPFSFSLFSSYLPSPLSTSFSSRSPLLSALFLPAHPASPSAYGDLPTENLPLALGSHGLAAPLVAEPTRHSIPPGTLFVSAFKRTNRCALLSLHSSNPPFSVQRGLFDPPTRSHKRPRRRGSETTASILVDERYPSPTADQKVFPSEPG